MSIECNWDLRASASPRSLSVFSVVNTDTKGKVSSFIAGTNPFDPPQQNVDSSSRSETQPSEAVAVVYGTENGSLHYRTYDARSLHPQQQQNQAQNRTGFNPGNNPNTPVLPLGINGNMGNQSKSVFSLSGTSSTMGNQTANATMLPRQFYPIDLTNGALSGPVVSCIFLGGGNTAPSSSTNFRNQYQTSQPSKQQQQQQQPPKPAGSYPTGSFLLLIDDGRGTSVTQPGAYAAVFVKASMGSFQLVKPNFASVPNQQSSSSSSLPRMSCASYYIPDGVVGNGGMLVYGAGRTIQQIPSEVWDPEDHATTATKRSNSNQQQTQNPRGSTNNPQSSSRRAAALRQSVLQRSRTLYFPTSSLPSPGVRTGQDGLAITSNGNVVVCAVGNSFYAVCGTTSIDDNKTVRGEPSNRVIKLLSFQLSSQVHPVIVLDVMDETLGPEWVCLFLASGRECAVTDLYCDNTTSPLFLDIMSGGGNEDSGGPRLHSSKPRNGVVTLASPILAAATSWPWIAVLTSDGLISIRSPSCLAIPLRTVEVGQRPNDYFILRTVLPTSRTYGDSIVKGFTADGALTNGQISTNATALRKATIAQDKQAIPWIVAVAYSGESKVLKCHPDSFQDLADRVMRHSIDAFGATGFPRAELAEAVHASFTATSYVGPEPSPSSRSLLQQYLEAILGLTDFESGASPGWPVATTDGGDRRMSSPAVSSTSGPASDYHGSFAQSITTVTIASVGGNSKDAESATPLQMSPPVLLTCTALLCLVCSQLNPLTNSSLASRAAKACAEKIGVVFEGSGEISKAAAKVCDMIAERLLREASSSFTLLSGSSPSPIASSTLGRRSLRGGSSQQPNTMTDFIEAAIWLFRSCGKHERAIEVAFERLHQPSSYNNLSAEVIDITAGSNASAINAKGAWSQIKYESHTATHLSDLWTAGTEEGCSLVLSSPATYRLLENNPQLGLSVFTALHPQNESQWRAMPARDDPLANPDRIYRVLKLLKSINPAVPDDGDFSKKSGVDSNRNGFGKLPLESGRAVTVTFLVSAMGIHTGRPADEEEFNSIPRNSEFEEHVANFHDELSFLLLEGVIAERRDDEPLKQHDDDDNTELGKIYRAMLRQLLKWPLAKIRSERFMKALPSIFLQEKALLLGRLGRHEDALRILYRDLQNLDLALEYCDHRYARQKARQEIARIRYQQRLHSSILYPDNDPSVLEGTSQSAEDNAYLPLVRVALDSSDTEQGTATAIKVLALRRGAIDRAAALRLLPSNVPVSAVARPFLIPALVDSESQVRRLKVVSALLRARYLRLKDELTSAQLKAQASIHVVPALRNLNLGNPLHSTKAFKVRSSASSTSPAAGSSTSNMPEVFVIKHFFPRHLVIQARITNSNSVLQDKQYAMHNAGLGASIGRTLSDIAFVVAESSEEAIQPLLQVPISLLPWKMTGSAWCVLQAAPALMEGTTAQLTCELRYTVQSVDASSALSSAMGSPSLMATAGYGRTYVEELQDLEVHATHFS